MASGHAPKCTCSHTPPEDPSEATSTDLCSPTPGHTFLTNHLLGQIVTTGHVQQFFDILKSLSTSQGSPLPATTNEVKSEELLARASKLEFKTVNEVYVSNPTQVYVY